MAANGAQGSDREWTDILEYLVKHYSPIAVNKATATELATTLDVPAAVAEAIVRARTEKGRLASIEELKQAAGGDAVPKIDARKDRLVF
jgi:competence protein ComEA